MKVAVTGASGHIGNCLVRQLIKRGMEVKVLVHNFMNDLSDFNIEIIRGSLENRGSLNKLCEGTEVVFHLAARISIDRRSTYGVYNTNVEGTRNILEISQANNIRRFIHFSSIHALMNEPLSQVLNENRPLVNTADMAYEQSKADSEKLVYEAVTAGLDAVILNPTAVIGPYDFKPSYLGQALIKMYRNKLPVLVRGGYNWVDVRDVAEAAINSMQMGRTGERYILSGEWLSLKELAQLAESIGGRKIRQFIAPVWLARLGLPFIRFYAGLLNEDPLYNADSLNVLINSHRQISNEKARKELEFRPRPLRETLNDTFEWFRQNKYMT
jgi:dihydroflavonol-4-reductase